MVEKQFRGQAKQFLKRVPGVQGVNRVRLQILRVRELTDLIKKNKIILFPDYSKADNNSKTREITHEVIKEWLDLYGTIHLRERTASDIYSKAQTILLWGPMAMLEIPPTLEEYLNKVERETRRVIRVAKNQGYEFHEFIWNEHLDDIYEINTSKVLRQSEPMRGWYREPVQPRYHSEEDLRYRRYYGAFKDGKLYAYFHFYVCGGLAIGKHFLGHAQHLRFGIMNGLVYYTIRECLNDPQIRWLNYGDWQRSGSLSAFKQHAGFQGYAILFDLEDDPELLKYSTRKLRTIWRI